VYAIGILFAVPDRARAPSVDVILEGVLRHQSSVNNQIEHVRILRSSDAFHAVLFVTAGSPVEAAVLGSVIGFATASAIPTLRFAGVRPWPDADIGEFPAQYLPAPREP
jgi:hypothetical protein